MKNRNAKARVPRREITFLIGSIGPICLISPLGPIRPIGPS